MRKGFFLVEMMGIMVVMIMVAVVMIKPMRNITRDIPHMYQDYQSNTIINDVLTELRKDIESSSGLMKYQGNAAASGDMLLIDSPQGVISYSFQHGRVFRSQDHHEDAESQDGQIVWEIPNAKIDWKLRAHDGKDVAVEISTGINRRGPSGMKTNLKNSHVLFVGGNMFLEQL